MESIAAVYGDFILHVTDGASMGGTTSACTERFEHAFAMLSRKEEATEEQRGELDGALAKATRMLFFESGITAHTSANAALASAVAASTRRHGIIR